MGLDKEADLVHMEARTADGRECLSAELIKSEKRRVNSIWLIFVLQFAF